jgi:hypothetical protein
MAENYFAKLERVWEQNRKTVLGSTLQTLYRFSKRAKSLRGSDFTKELIRLAGLTKDTRFQDAVFALIEHDIIDNNFNFLPWEAPAVAKVQKQIELMMFTFIYWVTSRGAPLRRACAQLAALSGWPAVSFAAAMKDLELIYRRHLAKERCFDPDESKLALDLFKKFTAIETRYCGTEKLELSRSISIPTTVGD